MVKIYAFDDHDLLCDWHGEGESSYCDCPKIARVRADEREHLIECIETAGCGICGKSYTQIEAEVRERIAQECERTGNHHGAAIARGGGDE